MYIEMKKATGEQLVAKMPELGGVIKEASIYAKEELKVDYRKLGVNGLEVLHGVAKESGERGLMMQLTSMINAIKAPRTTKLGSLKAFKAGLTAFLRDEAIDGWLYERDSAGEPMPSLVTEVRYLDPDPRHDRPAQVRLGICRNRRGEFNEVDFTFDLGAVQKMTVAEVLASKGLHKETPELKAVYEEHLAAYLGFRDLHGKQFVCSGEAYETEGYRRNAINARGHKMVNDEDLMTKSKYKVRVAEQFWADAETEEDKFCLVPMHPYLYMFDLKVHANVWVHVASLKLYVYQPELRDKLVLPDLHRDLIDVLASDMDVLMEDVVGDKSGGSIILCRGAPGLGKTLTAQVWSEVVATPLYSVHGGQLGSSAASVEKSLGTILERAARWGAVLLLDEADVYIRRRGDDMEQSAVVAVFLRVLETYSGLMFMTTNRGAEVDDAIESRCIALITYEVPDKGDTKLLWKILSKQFGADIDEKLVDDLVDAFGCMAGRDIKGLVKLASKFARKRGAPYSVELFRQCGQFRGVV